MTRPLSAALVMYHVLAIEPRPEGISGGSKLISMGSGSIVSARHWPLQVTPNCEVYLWVGPRSSWKIPEIGPSPSFTNGIYWYWSTSWVGNRGPSVAVFPKYVCSWSVSQRSRMRKNRLTTKIGLEARPRQISNFWIHAALMYSYLLNGK